MEIQRRSGSQISTDPIEDWWVEISLGRTVPVERLRLQYVDAELGDPFRRLLVFFEDAQFPLVEEDANFQFEGTRTASGHQRGATGDRHRRRADQRPIVLRLGAAWWRNGWSNLGRV